MNTVENGVAYLDKLCPNWFNLVNTDTLDMTLNCILDQVFGCYGNHIQYKSKGWSEAHGFCGDNLKDQWIKVIQERRL